METYDEYNDRTRIEEDKTVLEWFNAVKNERVRSILIERLSDSDPFNRHIPCGSLKEAILVGFEWDKTPEGEDYWGNIYENPEQLEELINEPNPRSLKDKILEIIQDEYPELKKEKSIK